MIKSSVCCDICGDVLPKKTVATPFGLIETYKTEKTKEWDVSKVFPHLCKKCALTIDNELLKFKLNVLQDEVEKK